MKLIIEGSELNMYMDAFKNLDKKAEELKEIKQEISDAINYNPNHKIIGINNELIRDIYVKYSK